MITVTHEQRRTVPTALEPMDLRILGDLASGAKLDVIARSNYLSERSVRRRIRRVCGMFEVTTPIEAVVYAVRRGVI